MEKASGIDGITVEVLLLRGVFFRKIITKIG